MKGTNNMKKQIEEILGNANFTNAVWIGYPIIKDGKVYINAKGRNLYVVQNFRDIFGGTSNAGSVKVLSRLLMKKEKGYCFILDKKRMEEILKGIEVL